MTVNDSSRSDDGGQSFWRLITAPEDAPPPADEPCLEAWTARLAYLLSLPLADHALSRAQARFGRRFYDAETVTQARLMNRFTRGAQENCLRTIAESGIDFVVVKGLALGWTLYQDPDLRVSPSGDLDILLRESDLTAVVSVLTDLEYRFVSVTDKPWGFISSASFWPFMSPDGAVNLDLHVHPDCYPLYRGLDTEAVFEKSQWIETPQGGFRGPSAEHTLLLLVSNVAKDKFGPFAIKKIIDGIFLLSSGQDFDWTEIRTLSRRAHLSRPLKAFFALIGELGLDLSRMPGDLRVRPRGLAGLEFDRAVAEWRALFPRELDSVATLRRELLLSAELPVGLYNNWLRLRGLVRPASGVPSFVAQAEDRKATQGESP